MMTGVIALYFLSLALFLADGKFRKKFLALAENGALFAGWALHAYLLVTRALQAHRFPLTDTYETLILFAWLLAVISFFAAFRFEFRWIKLLGLGGARCRTTSRASSSAEYCDGATLVCRRSAALFEV